MLRPFSIQLDEQLIKRLKEDKIRKIKEMQLSKLSWNDYMKDIITIYFNYMDDLYQPVIKDVKFTRTVATPPDKKWWRAIFR